MKSNGSKRLALLFGLCQSLGFLLGMAASHVDASLWYSSTVLLLPGSLLDLLLFKQGAIGNYWPKWALFVIPIACNAVLFVLLMFVRHRYRTARAIRANR